MKNYQSLSSCYQHQHSASVNNTTYALIILHITLNRSIKYKTKILNKT
jgi:hypothetical protein